MKPLNYSIFEVMEFIPPPDPVKRAFFPPDYHIVGSDIFRRNFMLPAKKNA
jgi:hypothetical protein